MQHAYTSFIKLVNLQTNSKYSLRDNSSDVGDWKSLAPPGFILTWSSSVSAWDKIGHRFLFNKMDSCKTCAASFYSTTQHGECARSTLDLHVCAKCVQVAHTPLAHILHMFCQRICTLHVCFPCIYAFNAHCIMFAWHTSVTFIIADWLLVALFTVVKNVWGVSGRSRVVRWVRTNPLSRRKILLTYSECSLVCLCQK